MRWFKKRKTLFSVVCPTERMRAFPAFDSRYVHRVGANLASAIACLHDAGIVVGDLSESNVLVASDATVALVDVDSFQFEMPGGALHACPVGKPEFLPPEHHGEFFAETPKSPESDAFALAVLLFQMLFDGPHPFSGVYRGAGLPPTIGEAIVGGDYVFATGSALAPRLGMPGSTVVAPAIMEAFERTFVDGLHRPNRRTSTREWATLLARAEAELVRCPQVASHRRPRDSATCGWCERRSAFGRAFETFTQAPANGSAPIALPVAELAPPTQRPLPRVLDDESPLPPSVVGLDVHDAPRLDDGTAGEAATARSHRPPRIRRRTGPPRAGRTAGARMRTRLESETPTSLEQDTEPQSLHHAAAPSASQAPSELESATRAMPTSPAKGRVGLRHVVGAALLVTAFALGRSSAPVPPAPNAEHPQTAAHGPLHAPRAPVDATRGSAVLRREAVSAERRSSRPAR
jgi:hypothetical protein